MTADAPPVVRIGTLATRQHLAAVLGVDPRTVARLVEEGMPVAQRGRGGRPSLYDLRACVPWWRDRAVLARGPAEMANLSPPHQRALLDAMRREEIDLRLRVRRGELLERDEVARAGGTSAAPCKENFARCRTRRLTRC
jgi:phage terminase Nu1 subunit (DNA packaging protein)